MFDKLAKIPVLNPLNINKNSRFNFKYSFLPEVGTLKFSKIIEFIVGNKKYVRYLLNSKINNEEFILEVFPASPKPEVFLYKLSDTIPFSEEFLSVAGQRYLNTPEGNEYIRSINSDIDHVAGLSGSVTVYNFETNKIDEQYEVDLWDYDRDVDDETKEFLNIEMNKQNGMFRIFIGELLSEILYDLM